MLRSTVAVLAGLALAAPAAAATFTFHGALNGELLNFAVDRTGTEGMLGESISLGGGRFETALETFDLSTGNLVAFIKHKHNTKGQDAVPLAVTADHTGLYVVEKTNSHTGHLTDSIFETIAPLSGNTITGTWTPPGNRRANAVARSLDTTTNTTAFLFEKGHGQQKVYMFSSDVTANTFTPRFDLPGRFNLSSKIEYDASSGHAILSSSSCPSCKAQLWTADLSTGAIAQLVKLGRGPVIGMAGDAADQVLCTTTSSDFSVEFYNLATHVTQTFVLPNATTTDHIGTYVSYDAVNHLFLVSQEHSSTGSGNLYLYAPDGTLTGTIAGVNATFTGFNSTLRKAYGATSLKDILVVDY